MLQFEYESYLSADSDIAELFSVITTTLNTVYHAFLDSPILALILEGISKLWEGPLFPDPRKIRY